MMNHFERCCETRGYVEAAPTSLLRALRVALSELHRLPARPTPDDAQACVLRRRLLELRLLIDFNAYAYDPDLLTIYRGVLDQAYECIGAYKDIHVAEALLGEQLCPQLVDRRLLKMMVAIAPLRLPAVRQTLSGFLATPCGGLWPLARKQTPRIWSLAETSPSDDHDAVGNVARLGHRVLRKLTAPQLLVADIFDPKQEERFHDVRKAARSVLALGELFSATRDGTADPREPLLRLVSTYGEVHDRLIAYRAARTIGRRVDERANDLSTTFFRTRAEHWRALEEGSFEPLIERLKLIEQDHRRAQYSAVALPPAA